MKQNNKDGAWRASRDGPWPVVHTHGRLEEAEREWLHTNGAGAYSMSTLALMHTRREHGLLVAAMQPPLDPYVVLSHAETTVEANQRQYRLSTHRFPEVAPTPGYRLLQTFAQDPIPRWVYVLGKHKLERTACLARGVNALVLSYTWRGRAPARLWLKPLMPLRPAYQLMREHGACSGSRSAKVRSRCSPSPSCHPSRLGTTACSWARQIGGGASSISKIGTASSTIRKTCGRREY
jgi:hypothetical protein